MGSTVDTLPAKRPAPTGSISQFMLNSCLGSGEKWKPSKISTSDSESELRAKCVETRKYSSEGHKRLKLSSDGSPYSNVVDYSDPFAISAVLNRLDSGEFGSVTKDIEALRVQKMQMLGPYFAKYPSLINQLLKVATNHTEETVKLEFEPVTSAHQGLIKLEGGQIKKNVPAAPTSIVIIDSDDEDDNDKNSDPRFHQVVLPAPVRPSPALQMNGHAPIEFDEKSKVPKIEKSLDGQDTSPRDKGIYVGIQEEEDEVEEKDDGLDDEDDNDKNSDPRFHQVVLPAPVRPSPALQMNKSKVPKIEKSLDGQDTSPRDKGIYVGIQEEEDEVEEKDDGLGDIWREMSMAIECSKLLRCNLARLHDQLLILQDCYYSGIAKEDHKIIGNKEATSFLYVFHKRKGSHGLFPSSSPSPCATTFNVSCFKLVVCSVFFHHLNVDEVKGYGDINDDASMNVLDEEEEKEEDCDHSFVLKDDLGYVCRVCGVIERSIETIFEFQYKVKRSTRTYASDSWSSKEKAAMLGIHVAEDDLVVTDISAHPRHMKQMKPHQVEGFNFLVRNLAGDNPGGCILAHAPGSGKTFMIISFMQSFLGKYPNGRPLVVLPKGILSIWKKEFQRWQVEDIPLLDFYSVKADNRSQQLEVLKKWKDQKSILFLGYKQFSTVVCDDSTSRASVDCQEILLKVPSILILDEGHTPRNENTDIMQSLSKVRTPRKVVLSGTLYQNHVQEVFNILDLVRPPKFLKMETSKPIVKRIYSRVHVPGVRNFCDLVEHTLQKDTDFRRKVAVIQDLREMTSKVLHYYKGDFLDELPGMVDFTVVLNLTSRQKHEVEKLKRLSRKFKISSVGSATYLHPKLKPVAEKCGENSISDNIIDELIDKLDVKDGVKSKFFRNMLNMCESAGEKLLVFSQYLLPLKYLERLAVKWNGWSLGKEIFVISGESSPEQREWSMEKFNSSSDAKVFFGSIKACGEGISLVGASRVIIMDVHLNPSVTRQAIGRAFRPGQTKKVFVYRLLAADSPEEEDHATCFKKELISKMWFEWNEYCGDSAFEVESVPVKECGDFFLESNSLAEDVKALYRR
ncbi:hypothetical protein Ahy_A08g040625 isoform B [Arachis hypogaea]|nr:hypothetical protein Ahy_A08g040625 isoform B [Arachis hypogaea]